MDVFAEAEGLKRRRALLERMQQQAANPAIQGPRKYAIAQLLASLATQQQASRGLKGIDSAEAANREQYGTELGSEMERYIGRQEGDPGAPQLPGAPAVPEVAPGMPGLPAMPAVSAINPTAPQPRRAVFDAIASRFPEMQAVGKAGMAEMLKKPPAPPKPDNWSMAPDGTPYRTGPNGEFIKGPGNFGKADKPVVEIQNYPKASEAAMAERVKAVQPKGVYNEEAESHRANLIGTQEAVAALAQGASTGQFEPFFQGVRKFLGRFGVENAATAPTDALGSMLAKRVYAMAGGKLGGNFSNTDLQFVKDMEGSTTTDANALRRLLAIGAALSLNKLSEYNGEIDDIAKLPNFEYVKRYAKPSRFLGSVDPEFDAMMENAWQGKPTVGDGGVPAKKPAAPNAPPKSSDPRIRFPGG